MLMITTHYRSVNSNHSEVGTQLQEGDITTEKTKANSGGNVRKGPLQQLGMNTHGSSAVENNMQVLS